MLERWLLRLRTGTAVFVCLTVGCFGSGCRGPQEVSSGPVFRDHYQGLTEAVSERPATVEETSGPRITLSCQEITLGALCQWIAAETGSSIVVQQGLEGLPVSLEIREEPLGAVMDVLAARLGVSLDRRGTLYYLGQTRPESRGVLVRRVRRLSRDEIQQAVAVHLTTEGKSAVFADGLLVVGDRVAILERIGDVLDQVEAAQSPCWCVQCYIVALTDSEIHDIGLDVAPALEVSAAFASGSQLAGLGTLSAKGGLDAVLKAATSSDVNRVLAQPLFLLGDGEKATVKRTVSYPVPMDSLSQDGQVSSRSWEYVEAGLTLDVELRERSSRSAKLGVVLEVSDVEGFKEDAPIRAGESFASSATLESGGVYLLGSLEREGKRSGKSSLLQWRWKSDTERHTLFVWCRAYAVSGPSGSRGGEFRAGPAAARSAGPVVEVNEETSTEPVEVKGDFPGLMELEARDSESMLQGAGLAPFDLRPHLAPNSAGRPGDGGPALVGQEGLGVAGGVVDDGPPRPGPVRARER